MCLLCHQLVGQESWSDVRSGAGASRGRDRRTPVIAAVLRCYGLDYRDDASGALGLVSDRKGKTKVVSGLEEVWSAATLLAGRPLDPLDPRLLDQLADD